MEIITQRVGVLGIVASIISFQCKEHKKILFFRSMNEFLFAVQYLMLGAYTGMAMNLVGCVRNAIFAIRNRKEKDNRIVLIIFLGLFLIFGILTWEGPKSILIICAKIASSVAYGNKNTTFVRCMIFITSSCWLVYNLYAGSIAGFLCEVFTLGSISVGMMRFDILPAVRRNKVTGDEWT